jgi:AraC-like DNA-binding protein
MIKKREGFEGQKAIVLPKKTHEFCSRTPPFRSLYITDLGFYPHAQYHHRERHSGSSQAILICCVDGKGWVELPSGRFTLNANQYAIIPAEVPHKYGADEKRPWTIYWFHFKGDNCAYFTDLLSKQSKSFVNDGIFMEHQIKIFESVYKNLEAGYSHDNLAYSSISLQYLLTCLCFPDKLTPAVNSPQKDAVDISIEYMQSHLENSINLDSLASHVNLSLSHYASIFRKKTGYTPIVYFNHLKIQRACQFLHFTSLRINEISFKLGIEDPYYFSRLFTKTMGISPTDYRRKKH